MVPLRYIASFQWTSSGKSSHGKRIGDYEAYRQRLEGLEQTQEDSHCDVSDLQEAKQKIDHTRPTLLQFRYQKETGSDQSTTLRIRFNARLSELPQRFFLTYIFP
jgi:predicted metal-dependent hydrolase